MFLTPTFMTLAVSFIPNLKRLAVEATFDNLLAALNLMWDQFVKMAQELLSTPLFLIPLAIFVVGAAIGLVKRIV